MLNGNNHEDQGERASGLAFERSVEAVDCDPTRTEVFVNYKR